MIAIAVHDRAEGTDAFLHGHIFARNAGKRFRHGKRLGKETLQTPRTVNDLLILRGKLLHTEDGDDVLQLVVALQAFLHALCGLIVLLAHDERIEDARMGLEWVNGRVDARFRNGTGKDGRRIQVGEDRNRRRVGKVIRRNVYRLDGGDGTIRGGGDALLQRAKLVGERGLVADRRGHAPEQCGDLAACLHIAEDVVDEQQHVLMHDIPEILRKRKPRERHAQACARRLVHLPEGKRGVVECAGVFHVKDHVAAFAAALAHACEHGIIAGIARHVVDELHDEDRLAHARAAKQADFRAFGVRGEQVDDLYARFKEFRLRVDLCDGRRLPVDAPALRCDRPLPVDGPPEHIDRAAEHGLAHRHGDAAARCGHSFTREEAVRWVKGDAAHLGGGNMRRNLHVDAAFGDEKLVDLRQVPRKARIQNRAGDADDGSFILHGFNPLLLRLLRPRP